MRLNLSVLVRISNAHAWACAIDCKSWQRPSAYTVLFRCNMEEAVFFAPEISDIVDLTRMILTSITYYLQSHVIVCLVPVLVLHPQSLEAPLKRS